jgi:hypothetical protein
MTRNKNKLAHRLTTSATKPQAPSVLLGCCFAAALSLHSALAQSAPAVKLIQQEKVIDVEIGGQPFTTYHFADDFIRPYVRPFLWPVRAGDGTEITIDQAQHPPLHAHQRSIWIGHSNVNGADHWKFNAKPIVPKQRHLKFDKVDGDTFAEELLWEDKEAKPMLNELRTLRFIAFPDGSRGIDFKLRFTPTEGDVTFFAGAKDTGLCPVRLLPSITREPELVNSAGGKGQEQCDMKPADWCDESGQINGKVYGVAILDHPENPRHPPLWHARRGARLSTDIFSLQTGDQVKDPKGSGNFTIKSGQAATFRYRMVIHTGNAAAAALPEKYKDYAAGK